MQWICHLVVGGAAVLGQTSDAAAPPAAKPGQLARPAAKPATPAPARPVDKRPAAKVDTETISVAEVNQEVAKVLPAESASPEVLALVRAQALAQLVDRRLVLVNLGRTKAAADPREVDVMIQRLVKQLEPRKITLDDHLRSLGIDEAGLRHQIAWRISWGRYLERYLTDENLQLYFQQHRREFDGSEVRVAHILLKPPATEAGSPEATASKEAWRATLEKASKLRARIEAGELTFEAAAKQYSEAPTAAQGGDIGFIRRREPMPESFSQAAFALDKDQISPPVTSSFGVHLIRCLEIKPGQGEWQAMRDDLEQAVTQYLFRWLADKVRSSTTIEFTGTVPHFAPGTTDVVPATAPAAP